ncbi:hypothetical protein BIW11_00384 [Tropilaelaps mercedesae]|uniref:Uncharacterized protein n=1 Tax=Tropilaelaps mercedesae TaxID=418985 RepID=A0A1V9XWP7_9ACAR|nr:hypothetical protein BIW11_00384 [Tropilaelaps mercedesae]
MSSIDPIQDVRIHRSKSGNSTNALLQSGQQQHFPVGSSVGSGGFLAREPLGVLGELGDGTDDLGPLALSLPSLSASATGSPAGLVDLRAANDEQFSAALASSDDSEMSSGSESESPQPLGAFPGANKLRLSLPPVFPDSGQPPPPASWLNPHRPPPGPAHGTAIDHTGPPHGEFPRDDDGGQFRRLSSLLSGMLPMRHAE